LQLDGILFPCAVWGPVHSVIVFKCRLLLYFSLFGFTLEPRCYRDRYKPPHSFLQHIDFSSPSRQHSTSPSDLLHQDLASNAVSSSNSPPHNSGIHSTKSPMLASHGSSGVHHNEPSSPYHRQSHGSDLISRKVTSHVITNLRRIKSAAQSPQNHVLLRGKAGPPASDSSIVGVRWNENACDYNPECSLLLPCTPDEVRDEVDILLSDLMVRLKQLLFNSLLCAYYVGFIPMQFADVS
jgi:hypothetical protein